MALQKIDVGENVINREEENKQEKNYQEILEKQEKNDLDISFQVLACTGDCRF